MIQCADLVRLMNKGKDLNSDSSDIDMKKNTDTYFLQDVCICVICVAKITTTESSNELIKMKVTSGLTHHERE